MEFFARSTGIVEVVVFLVKPFHDVGNPIALPHRFKNLVIATGAGLKVKPGDPYGPERFT